MSRDHGLGLRRGVGLRSAIVIEPERDTDTHTVTDDSESEAEWRVHKVKTITINIIDVVINNQQVVGSITKETKREHAMSITLYLTTDPMQHNPNWKRRTRNNRIQIIQLICRQRRTPLHTSPPSLLSERKNLSNFLSDDVHEPIRLTLLSSTVRLVHATDLNMYLARYLGQ